jgi:uncharacterized protein YegJ (DUF2314 family)
MRSISAVVRFTACAVLASLAACSVSDDAVLSVSADDPEMNAAISQARESLADFWQVFDSRDRGESDFALKVRIEDSHGIEHFWVTDLRRDAGNVYGLIGNDPNTVTSVKLGDEIEVPQDDVTDWLYMRDEKMVGNFTL